MSVERDLSYLQSLLRELCALPQETESSSLPSRLD